MTRVIVLIASLALVVWVAADLAAPAHHDLRQFDAHEVGHLETEMWRSYYDHQRVRLFEELAELLRRQYRLPFWKSCAGAYYAARAAVVFQRGHGREEYMRALPDLDHFYSLISRNSTAPFDIHRAAALELEWWIIHRERMRHPPGDLERALAQLQAHIYGMPESRFEEHAKARAEAMLIRDMRAAAGSPSDQDWRKIAELLDRSWTSLHDAVAR